MNISATGTPSSITPPKGGNAQIQSSSQSQSSYQTSQSSITMKTAEGDVVTISGFTAAGSLTEQNEWQKAMQAGASFTEANLLSSSLQMSVKGDLNDQELQDINNLLNDLHQISSTFFAGDSAQAMQQALAIGDMGSVTDLQANFQYTAVSSSQYAYHHPIPASFSDQLQQMQQDLSSLSSQTGTSFDQLLQAQWDQINTFFNQQSEQAQSQPPQPTPGDQETAPTASPSQDSPSSADTSLAGLVDAMKNRIDATIAKHPRLSPHTLPVARKALQMAQTAGHTDNGNHYGQMLNGSIMHQLKNWLFAA